MLLNESFGNLDKLDKSFFDGKISIKGTLNNISPNSEVYVDKLRPIEGSEESRHTWKYLTDVLLQDKDVAFVIVRSNKRQLLLLSANRRVVPSVGTDGFYLKWSDLGYNLKSEQYDVAANNPNSEMTTSNGVSVRNKICKTVETFINSNANARKNWDVIVVKADYNISNIQDERQKSRENMEVKPSNASYSQYVKYISNLKNDLATRLVAYSESKLKNITSENDLKDVLNKRTSFFVPKIKIFNTIWQLYDTNTMINSDNNITGYAAYRNPNYGNTTYEDRQYDYLHLAFRISANEVKLEKIWANSSMSPRTIDDSSNKTFEEFLYHQLNYTNKDK